MTKWNELLEGGKLEGYQASSPSFDAAAIDGEVCRDSACPDCKHQGLEYRPYHNLKGSYRAFAVCSECDEVMEF
jgi:hypothetical protein